MKESKYLKEDGEDAKDDAEAETDGNLFKKRTHKQAKFSHSKGFGGPAQSFARKRKRIKWSAWWCNQNQARKCFEISFFDLNFRV